MIIACCNNLGCGRLRLSEVVDSPLCVVLREITVAVCPLPLAFMALALYRPRHLHVQHQAEQNTRIKEASGDAIDRKFRDSSFQSIQPRHSGAGSPILMRKTLSASGPPFISSAGYHGARFQVRSREGSSRRRSPSSSIVRARPN